MANQEAYKIPVSRLRFDEAINCRHSNIKTLGLVPEIARSDKTIRRYLHDGKMPPELLDRIAKHLDVSPDYISGQRDRDIDKIQDADLRETPEKRSACRTLPLSFQTAGRYL